MIYNPMPFNKNLTKMTSIHLLPMFFTITRKASTVGPANGTIAGDRVSRLISGLPPGGRWSDTLCSGPSHIQETRYGAVP